MSIIEEAKKYLISERNKNDYYTDSVKVMDIVDDLILKLEKTNKQLEQHNQVVEAADKHINSFIPIKCLDILSYRELREALNQLSEVK